MAHQLLLLQAGAGHGEVLLLSWMRRKLLRLLLLQ
jgi:hypothetical protein